MMIVAMTFLGLRTKTQSIPEQNTTWWIHQRHPNKKIYPGLWGIGSGGKGDPGENPAQTARRELQEELGIQVESWGGSLEPVLQFHWQENELQYQGHVFMSILTQQPVLHPCQREFSQWKWASHTEVHQLAQNNQLCPDTAFAWKTIFPNG